MSDTTPPFTIVAAPGRVRVLFEGHEVADSARAYRLEEPGHDPVYYFPREDVQMAVLRRNDHLSVCPWKGRASWFTIMRDARVVEDVAWSYEAVKDGASMIEGCIAFMPEHVAIEADDTPQPVRHVPPMDPPYVD
jgi:uncharacterized protein (DUF427 family)